MKQNIEHLFRKVSIETENFTSIKGLVLLKYPNSMRIFRLLAGNDQRSFAKLIGRNQQWVSAIERGFIHSLSPPEAERIASRIGTLKLATVSAGELAQLGVNIANKGKFYGEYARRMALRGIENSIKSAMAQKPTAQEESIASALRAKRIDFQIHEPVKVGGITFVCDFVIGNLPIIIEAKNLNTKYRTKPLIAELAYKSLRIKRFYPKAMVIAVLNRKAAITASERLVLSEEFDSLFFDDELEALANEISQSELAR